MILFTGVLASGVVLLSASDKVKDNTEKCTVTFAYLDGTVIDTKTVEKGKGVFPPELDDEGVFRGWSVAFNAVEKDVEAHPNYYSIKEDNLFYFDSVYVQEGNVFSLDVYVDGIVNISSGVLTLSYDPDVLEYTKVMEKENLSVVEDKKGELIISFNNDIPLNEKTLISEILFYAKEKDAYSTQVNLSASDMKIVLDGVEEPADCATIDNKVYFLQEVGE